MANSPNVGYIRPEVQIESTKWLLADDTVAGEMAVKTKGEVYLPIPQTNTDPLKNAQQYEKYKLRAVFFPVTGRTLNGLVGQVFAKPVDVDVPDSLGPLVKDIDGAGTSLEQQSKSTLAETLKKGRAGLLSDFPEIPQGTVVTKADLDAGRYRPRIIQYDAEQIINWREATVGGETQLSLLVIRENATIEDDGFELEYEPRWRVYRLDGETMTVKVQVWREAGEKGTADKLSQAEALRAGLNNPVSIERTTEYEPVGEEIELQGSSGPLTVIPFTFVGSINNDSTVDESPLYPLAALNIAHYRNSADYEQSAFLVGQVTPVVGGLTDDWVKNHIKGKVMVGSTNAVVLPVGGSFDLVQAQPNSLPMEAMAHKEDQMKAIGAKLIEPGSVQRTATEAEIEEVSESSILSSVAKNVSEAYEKAFYYASLFIGEVGPDTIGEVDPDTIEITLNSEFQVVALGAQERQEVVAAWMSGLLTKDEARDIYKRKGIATLPNEEAFALISAESVPEM